MQSPEIITDKAVSGDRQATRDLFRIVYDDLRRVAAARLAGEAVGNTLTATALVHEAFLKISPEAEWNDSAHLFRTAAKVMRHVLIDAARRRNSAKRGGLMDRKELDAEQVVVNRRAIDPVEFDEAINRLESASPQACSVFELRHYAELTWEQIAKELGISVEKANSLWEYAAAKIQQSLSAP